MFGSLHDIRVHLAGHWLKIENVEDIRRRRAGEGMAMLDACLKLKQDPDGTIERIAEIIKTRFPDRTVDENIGEGRYTRRLTLIGFNNHPDTKLQDILSVLELCEQ